MSSNGGKDGDDDSSFVDSRVNGDNIILALELLWLGWECYLLGMNQGKEEADIVTMDEENDTVWLILAPPLLDTNSD